MKGSNALSRAGRASRHRTALQNISSRSTILDPSAGSRHSDRSGTLGSCAVADYTPAVHELHYDIFISYAREDREFASMLAERFRAREWSVWWDHRMLPGEDFTSRIQNQLDSARCVVVVWSEHSVNSKYVRDEASEGLRGDRLVPVRIDGVRPPIGFRNVHTADLIDWRATTPPNDLAMLDEAVTRLVLREPEKAADAIASNRSIAGVTENGISRERYSGKAEAERVSREPDGHADRASRVPTSVSAHLDSRYGVAVAAGVVVLLATSSAWLFSRPQSSSPLPTQEVSTRATVPTTPSVEQLPAAPKSDEGRPEPNREGSPTARPPSRSELLPVRSEPPTSKPLSETPAVTPARPPAKQVDILLIVDNSASMDPEQEVLAGHYSDLVSPLGSIDWQIGITTTDVSVGIWGQKGSLLKLWNSADTILRYSTPNAAQVFYNTVLRQETVGCIQKGTCPSGLEQPLKASILAMDKRDSNNAGFFRAGADLAIIILSDEDEMSDGRPGSTTTREVIEHVLTLWPAKKLTVHAVVIVPDDKTCYDLQGKQFGATAYYGTAAASLARQTGGVVASICSPDFGQVASSIGHRIATASGLAN